jgi:hypothetical protein
MKAVLVSAVFLLLAQIGSALDVNMSKVDVEYTILSETTVRVSVDVTWETQSSSMQGFYLQLQNNTSRFNKENCFVRINNQDKVGVDITKINELRYDIDLEGGNRFKGTATYHIEYVTDPDEDEANRLILFICGWDQIVASQKITIITREKLALGLTPEIAAKSYYIAPSWDCQFVPIKVFSPTEVLLGFREEESAVPIMSERNIVFAKVAEDADCRRTAFNELSLREK